MEKVIGAMYTHEEVMEMAWNELLASGDPDPCAKKMSKIIDEKYEFNGTYWKDKQAYESQGPRVS